jgi:hypothetical protein
MVGHRRLRLWIVNRDVGSAEAGAVAITLWEHEEFIECLSSRVDNILLNYF